MQPGWKDKRASRSTYRLTIDNGPTVSILPRSKFGTFVLLPSVSPGAILVFMEATQMNKLTVKQALSQDVIRKHWQPAYKCYFYSADGCGDTLFPTAFSALGAWELKQSAKAVRS